MSYRNGRRVIGLFLGAALVAGQAPSAREQGTVQYPQQTGEALYHAICQGCHMPDGKGAVGAGAYPALARNPRLIVAAYPLAVVVNGQRAMPRFGADLSDQQIAAVVNYVRSHFGNAYTDAATAADVAPFRQAGTPP